MYGHWLALFALLAFSGVLRPVSRTVSALVDNIRDRMTSEVPSTDGPDSTADSSLILNPIELALIAELSLEQARAHDEVAHDENQRPDTRSAASATAAAWRERARMLQLEARRRSAHPMLPGARSPRTLASTYAGPERRRQIRRTQTRRTGPTAVADAVEARDRRLGSDRRERDRRLQPAPR